MTQVRALLCLVVALAIVSSAQARLFKIHRQDVCASSESDCSFYPNCFESRKACGANGYVLGFGLKYCQRFLDDQPNYAEQDQPWLNYVRKCLQDKLIEVLNRPDFDSLTCDQVNDIAINSHNDCYLNGPSSYCDLTFFDKARVITTVTDVFLTNRGFKVLKTGLSLMAKCVVEDEALNTV